MNIIERLEFELSYFVTTVQYISHYVIETLPAKKQIFKANYMRWWDAVK